jgi:Peptidase_C39 like family
MRQDNDVTSGRTTTRSTLFSNLRTRLIGTPRRAAAFGLAAAIGTGSLMLSTTHQQATHAELAKAAAVTSAVDGQSLHRTALTKSSVTRSADRAAKPAKPVKKAVKPVASKELRVKYQAQPNYYWCGPAAARNALTATGHNISMADLARQMGTTEAGTNSANDITAALNKVTGSHKYRTTELAKPTVSAKQADTLKRDIVATIDDHRAVVANVAGTAIDTDGMTHSYEGGHYIAVHGYRDHGRQVEIADSANPNTAHYWIDTADLANWMATRGYSH